MKEEDVGNVGDICQVSKMRAAELLEAASGNIGRAVEIYLEQPRNNPANDRSAIAAATTTTTAAAADDYEPVAPQVSRKKDNFVVKTSPASKKARIDKKAPPNGQGTLHAFLGLPKPKTLKQPKISSFFSKTEKNTASDDITVKAEETDPERNDSIKSQEQNDDKRTTASSPKEKPTSRNRIMAIDNRLRIIQDNGTTQRTAVKKEKADELEKEQSTQSQDRAAPSSPREDRKKASDNQPKIKEENKVTETESSRVTDTEFESENRNCGSSNASPSIRVGKETSERKQIDPRLRYSVLAKAFADMTSTTKRNTKLNILKTVLMGVIDAVGGIYGDAQDREEDGQTLICALELITGKVSLSQKPDSSVTAAPLQVSGAAVSTAIQAVTGGVAKKRLREVYRDTGDLGDTAADFFSPGQSVKNFFASRKSTSSNPGIVTEGASISQIHRLLQSIASVKPGTGSQKVRQGLLVQLLRLSTSKQEIRFLVRTLIGNMRLGATIKSILASLAMAIQEKETTDPACPQDPAVQLVQKTFDVCPRLDKIALNLLCGGIRKMLQECTLEVLVPIQPMLANPAHSLEEVEKFMFKSSGTVTFEWKLDGVRCQAHCEGSSMKLFSRHLQDTTSQFPDAIQSMLEARRDGQVQSFIIDSEIVAVAPQNRNDEETRLMPFQVLSTRRGTKSESSVQIRIYAFDLMYFNGTSLLSKPLWERQKILKDSFNESRDFAFVPHLSLSTFDENKITEYLQNAVKGGAEGLMVKMLGSQDGENSQPAKSEGVPSTLPCSYESGTRSATWLKLKRDYVSGFADTIDVVPMGAWYGNGRKAEKKFLSPVLLAVYDEDDGLFRSISRCMSFTDDMYTATREFYFNGTPYPEGVGLGTSVAMNSTLGVKVEPGCQDEDEPIEKQNVECIDLSDKSDAEVGNEISEMDFDAEFVGVNCFSGRPPSSVYVTNENCSIWFKPCEVWEVSFADLTLSRTHTAGAGFVDDAEGRGVALRFPRFKRRRPDKGVEQATTTTQIAQLFTQQCKQH